MKPDPKDLGTVCAILNVVLLSTYYGFSSLSGKKEFMTQDCGFYSICLSVYLFILFLSIGSKDKANLKTEFGKTKIFGAIFCVIYLPIRMNNSTLVSVAISSATSYFLMLMMINISFSIFPHFFANSLKNGLYLVSENRLDSYNRNVNDKISRHIRAQAKVLPFLIFAFVCLSIWYLKVAQEFNSNRILVKINVPRPMDPLGFFILNIKEMSTLFFGILTFHLAAFWNYDQIFGRVWAYCCSIYKEIICTKGDEKQKRDIIRCNLCIDIITHDMWNSPQFNVFLRYEIEKLFYLLKAGVLKCDAENYKSDVEKFTDQMLQNVLVGFSSYGFQLDSSNRKHAALPRQILFRDLDIWVLEYTSLKRTFGWLSEFLEREKYVEGKVCYTNTLPIISPDSMTLEDKMQILK